MPQAVAVVAGQPVRHHACVGRDLAVGEALERGLIVGLGVGEAHAPVGLRRHQHQFLVRAAFSPDQRLVHLHERCYGGRGEVIAPIG